MLGFYSEMSHALCRQEQYFNIKVGVSSTLHLCYYLAFSEVRTSVRNRRIIMKTGDRCKS